MTGFWRVRSSPNRRYFTLPLPQSRVNRPSPLQHLYLQVWLERTSNVRAGDIGPPVLPRFRLIIDDSRDPLYAIPYADAVRAIFAGDRLGLVLTQQDAGLSVEFD